MRQAPAIEVTLAPWMVEDRLPAPRAPRAGRARRPGLTPAVVLSLAGLLAACGAEATPGATSADPPGTAAEPSSTTVAEPADPAVHDPSLLEILPSAVGGLPLLPAPEAADVALADASLAGWARGLAYALAADPETGHAAIVLVAEVRPGMLDEALFRDYRDSFNAAACASAGGPAGNAERTIDGRLAHIGDCAGGLRIYHLRLADPDRVVSITSIGDTSLGEQLIENLGD